MSNSLAAYPHLTAPDAPRMIAVAVPLLGVAEVVGHGSNATIISWRDELAASGVNVAGLSDDDVPWCGLFVALCAHRAGKPVVADPLWARNWSKFGTRADRVSLGDVLVFSRKGGGGHVGLYVAEDAQQYHVLGGNQGNRVAIETIPKWRCIDRRRPPYHQQPASVRPYQVAAGGVVSISQA
ncbi:TIGR02594 family protein [Novosphingobium sp. FSY-8]|uniref:TIGR02594 family protein n=1 Tax=Novosphingobium ovatum TaxID=1908523 RepID=A0ABW9XFQ2_9SPHN|nr:TIGR02594 family protein [Novosphingobium ovatum]NBC37375.1 TIGR02594 family protein [Novosphingobium ovatum]